MREITEKQGVFVRFQLPARGIWVAGFFQSLVIVFPISGKLFGRTADD
jgi:hypothetical protein